MSRYNLSNHPLKNTVMAIAMMLFLALSFKLAGDLSTDSNTPALSQTDSVISTLNEPAKATVTAPTSIE